MSEVLSADFGAAVTRLNPSTMWDSTALLREGLGDLLSPGAETLLDMVTDDISFEFSFRVAGWDRAAGGKSALETYLPKVGELFRKP